MEQESAGDTRMQQFLQLEERMLQQNAENFRQIARELQERDQQLQAAIEIAKLGVWKIMLETKQVDCSPRCKSHLGFAPDANIDYSMVSQRLFPKKPEKLDQILLKSLEDKGMYEAEYQVKWLDGSIHWIVVSGQGQYAEDGQLLAVTGVTLDVTQRKEEEERKDTFIGIASHELKTPLTTVKGFTQLLKRQMHRLGMREQTTTLTRMEEQINALNKLVNELMDITRIQAGKLECIWEEVNIDELVRSIVEVQQQTSGQRESSQHTIKVSGEVQHTIIGDLALLERVFNNLITNAVKYSPKANAVDIWMGCVEESAVIKIRDYGIGIAQEELEHIFDRFYRASAAAKSRAIQGLGMGLWIAREIVKQHGGQITVESKQGEGSTFCVELPFSFVPEQATLLLDDSSVSGGSMSEK
jgi:PAS domain S-box-containing protein